MLSNRAKRGIEKPILTLQSKITIGDKHLGKTVEIVCDGDAQYVDFLVDSGKVYLDRQAKIYLAARRKDPNRNNVGMVDTGPREIDEYMNLPSERFYNSRNKG